MPCNETQNDRCMFWRKSKDKPSGIYVTQMIFFTAPVVKHIFSVWIPATRCNIVKVLATGLTRDGLDRRGCSGNPDGRAGAALWLPPYLTPPFIGFMCDPRLFGLDLQKLSQKYILRPIAALSVSPAAQFQLKLFSPIILNNATTASNFKLQMAN